MRYLIAVLATGLIVAVVVIVAVLLIGGRTA